jgi:predicted dehydrogenase/aryl-alcohol dehydrogenase-like predicted oxidoreductase
VTALRWGILSTARINEKMLAAARASDRAEVVAVASRDTERAKAYAKAHGIERAYGSYASLLADPAVDAIYISLPNHLHVEWSIRSLRSGKHVLCEKPLGRHPGDVTRAFDVADEAGLVLSEAFMWRHHPQTKKLQELIAQGAIGNVQRIRAVFAFNLAGPVASPRGLRGIAAHVKSRLRRPLDVEDVRLAPEYDGGALMDVGCYCVSAARLLAGEPTRAEAEQTLGPTGVDLHFSGRLEFPGGVGASFDCSLATQRRDELEVVGSKGSLFLDDPFLCEEPAIELRSDGSSERIEVERADSYRLELENVADAAAQRRPLLLGRADAVGQARALWALHRGADEGRWVDPTAAPTSPAPRPEMRYGQISLVGKPVSRLVLGVLDHTSDAEIHALLDAFFDVGGTAIDTAWLYRQGAHERVVGKWLEHGGLRERAVLLSKGAHTPHCTPEDLTRQLFESLDRLRTDHVELYLLHRDNEDVPVGEFVSVVNEHQAAGRIGSWGVSNWTPARVDAANAYAAEHGLNGVAALSNQLSLARLVEPTFPGGVSVGDDASLEWLERQQLPLLAYSSQARGFFARASDVPLAQLRRTKPGRRLATAVDLRVVGRPWAASHDANELVRSWFSRDNFERLRRARELAAQRGVRTTAVAAAYVLSQPFPTFALIGPRNEAELRASVEALDVDLSADELRWLDLRSETRSAHA